MPAPGARNPGQEHPAHPGPVKPDLLVQDAQKSADGAADGVQDDVIHIGHPVVKKLCELNKDREYRRSGRGKDNLPFQ